MTLNLAIRLSAGILSILTLIVLAPRPVSADPVVTIEFDTVYIYQGLTHVEMPVHIHPASDTLAGLTLFFDLKQPDLCTLHSSIELSECILEPWPYVEIDPVATDDYTLRLQAIGIDLSGPVNPITPESSGRPALKLKLDAFDTIHPWAADTVWITLNTQAVSNFEIVNKWGFNIVQTGSAIDTSKFSIKRGPIILKRGICGDVNDDGTGPDISDLTRLVSFLFLNGPTPPEWWQANVNNSPDGTIDISDVTVLVNRLFVDGSPLRCYVSGE